MRRKGSGAGAFRKVLPKRIGFYMRPEKDYRLIALYLQKKGLSRYTSRSMRQKGLSVGELNNDQHHAVGLFEIPCTINWVAVKELKLSYHNGYI